MLGESQPDCSVPTTVWITFGAVLPAFVAIGVVGNVLSMLVLSRRRFRTSVMYAYLKGVAVLDLTYLILTAQECYFVLHSHMWLDPRQRKGGDMEDIASIISEIFGIGNIFCGQAIRRLL